MPLATRLVLGSSGTFDIAATNQTVAQLTGSGTLYNSGGAATFTVGYDHNLAITGNGSLGLGGTVSTGGDSSTFSGVMTAATPANLAITKIGSGTFTFTTNNTTGGGVTNPATGAVTVNGGVFALSGNGAVSASSVAVNQGGTLLLDNSSGTGAAPRVPLATTVTLNGGEFLYRANSAGGTAAVNQFAFGPGTSAVAVDVLTNSTSAGMVLTPNNNTLGGITAGATQVYLRPKVFAVLHYC